MKNKIADFIKKLKSNIEAQKNKPKKRKMKDYEYSESKKNEELFKLITKYVIFLILGGLLIVLIIAFFKVFSFSEEITKHPERKTTKEIVKGVDFGVSSQYSWKDMISQRESKNEQDVKELKKNIKTLSIQQENSTVSLKEFIKNTNKDLFARIDKSIEGTKRELYGFVEKNNQKIKQDIEKIKNRTPQQLNGTLMSVPSSVVSIKKEAKKIVNGIMLDRNETASIEKKKNTQEAKQKQEKKALREEDKKIYKSINIESVNVDSSDFDIVENSNSGETNTSLPPVVLRQGMTNGVLVTGISAPTFAKKEQAAPVLITFKGKSIISNMFEQDVENCTATGSVFGNIITRRGEILINKISCTYKQDGKMYMVRSNVKGWVYDGYDGRLGVPGILVDSSRSIIDDSVIIGLLQGFGNFLSSTAGIYAQQGQSAINTTGAPVYSPADIAKINIAGGLGTQLSSGFNTITGYYQKIIDSLYPYIDIKGGRKISIFFDGGEVLTPKEYTPLLINEDHDTLGKSDSEEQDNLNDMEREVSIDEW